jgi:hypothetical protein
VSTPATTRGSAVLFFSQTTQVHPTLWRTDYPGKGHTVSNRLPRHRSQCVEQATQVKPHCCEQTIQVKSHCGEQTIQIEATLLRTDYPGRSHTVAITSRFFEKKKTKIYICNFRSRKTNGNE